jgi:hypothetical protein
VDDDERRIAAALVGVAQLRAENAVARRLLRSTAAAAARVSLGVGSFTIAAA